MTMGIMNVCHVDRNIVILHPFKSNVKIKASATARILKELVWWNREGSCVKIVSCVSRNDAIFHTIA